MLRPLALLLAAVISGLMSLSTLACDGPKIDQQLFANESKTLLENAPTFRYGWEDGTITLHFGEPRAVAEGCSARMHLSLPQKDLDDVNAYLDQNPAKRILLGAQGYAIPEDRNIEIDYRYTLQAGVPAVADQGNQPLKDLHHSIEFMYQLLAQIRADIGPDARNDQPWPAEVKTRANARCADSLKSDGKPIGAACDCRVEALQQQMGARQMTLIDYLLEQPYVAATGALSSYFDLSNAINHRCGLSKR
ncbi:MAG TPA: hypothetical protein VN063_01220 [Methylophilaceae bacterium]|nr:hypothetical protein [Methylophilaceae bacterium]